MASEEFNRGLEKFGIQLFSKLSKAHPEKNIIFSPFSISTCIAMARMGAVGDTALEIDRALGLPHSNLDDLADSYHNVLAVYENSNIIKIANKIYVMKAFKVHEKFHDTLSKKFFSAADEIDFEANAEAASTINSWVETKTNKLITNLISPNMLNVNTRLVLLNAIHFKGKWVYQFPERATREADFYVDDTNSVKVQMMRISESFSYGIFPELDATALKMPYKDTDLNMLIILPNKRTGLAELVEKLKTVSLHDLSKEMFSEKVVVEIPKFKAEFDAVLNKPLQKLGMSRMFSQNAEFDKMLISDEPLQVSEVVHKAFIEVNEAGTEAAAASWRKTFLYLKLRKVFAMHYQSVSIPQPRRFKADHGFYYAIISENSLVLFEGKLEKL